MTKNEAVEELRTLCKTLLYIDYEVASSNDVCTLTLIHEMTCYNYNIDLMDLMNMSRDKMKDVIKKTMYGLAEELFWRGE